MDAGGLAQAPAGAPAAVKQVIAAGNAISGLPYAYGGGHGSFRADAYDCSGSVSYALAAAGLLSSPLDSTGFESWGEAGPGTLDHGLRERGPRVHGRRRLALRHELPLAEQHALDARDAQQRRLRRAPSRRALADAAHSVPAVGAAFGWGALAASSLVIGALLGLARPWPDRLVGLVLAFGAGALISAVSFDLAQEGAQTGDNGVVGVGLAVGGLVYFGLNRLVGRKSRHSGGDDETGPALALGAFLDGIPEQLVLGISIAAGKGVGVGLLVAIFVSNLPEAVGSSTAMKKAGTHPAVIRRMWIAVALVCTASTVLGYAIADTVSANAAPVSKALPPAPCS